MVKPRRAATAGETIEASPLSRPSRAKRGLVKKSLAPMAVTGLVASATVIAMLTQGQLQATQTDAITATQPTVMGVSRDLEREPLSASPEPSASPSVSASPSPSPTPSATPSATESASETASESATPTETQATDYSKAAKEAGTQYATANVNVRSGPGTSYSKVGYKDEGDKTTVTEWRVNDWQQVIVADEVGWIKADYLSTEKPETTSSSASGSGNEVCSRAAGVESGLTAKTVQVLRAVCNQFPNVSSFGGYRSGSGSYHNSGRAVDIMITGEAGWEIANWARANASELGVVEVLYSQKIWTTQRSGEGWRSFSDRGSDTANHYDHVHLSVG